MVVLGGTFDPVHNGHLSVLQQAVDQTRAGWGVLVPAATPNLRPEPAAPAALRLKMLRAAVDGMARLRVDDLELRRGGISYTIDTLRALEDSHRASPVALLVGADAARRIGAWHRAEELMLEHSFVIVNRTGEPPLSEAELVSLGYPARRTTVLHVDSPPISASDIRSRVAAGETVAHLVPAAVAEIIQREHLYSNAARRA